MAIHFMLGGASADELNAGSFTTGGAATWANSQGTGGAPIFSADNITAAEITDNGTTVTITRTGIGTDIAPNHWAYVDWSDGTFADGRYRITARAGDSVILDFGADAGAKPTTDTTKLRIGGAVKQGGADDTTHLQVLFDAAVAGDSLKLQGNLSVGATLDLDQASGTETDKLIIEGVNATTGNRLARTDTKPIIPTTVSLVNGLMQIDTGAGSAGDYIQIFNLNFDGGSSNDADYGLFCNDTGATRILVMDCDFHDTDLDCVSFGGNIITLLGCSFYNSRAGNGLNIPSTHGKIFSCVAYDNALDGFTSTASDVSYQYCVAYGNRDGFVLKIGSWMTVNNCTSVANSSDGFSLTSGNDMSCFNNVAVDNTGNGYTLGATIGATMLFFGNNHAFGNSAESSLGGTWADIGQGGNTNADPRFGSVVANNYAIGNKDVLASGILDSAGNPTLIGAAAITLTGVISKTRARYHHGKFGYKL